MRVRSIGLTISVCVALAVGCGGEAKSTTGEESSAKPAAPPALRGVQPQSPRAALDAATFVVRVSLTEGRQPAGGPAKNAGGATVQTHLSVVDKKLFYAETRRSGSAPTKPRSVAVVLSAEQLSVLEVLVRDLGLMTVQSIKTTKLPEGAHDFVSLRASIRLDGAEHAFTLTGVTAVPGQGATAFASTAGFRAIRRFVSEAASLANMAPAPAPSGKPGAGIRPDTDRTSR